MKGVAEANVVNYAAMDAVLADKWPVINPLYVSCMDETRIEQLGLSPLQPYLDALKPVDGPITNTTELWTWMGRVSAELGLSLAFTFTTVSFAANPRQPASAVTVGGGWTAPGIGNYIGVANISSTIKDGIAAVLQQVGDSQDWATQQANDIVNFETDLYRASTATYSPPSAHVADHTLTIEQLAQRTPTSPAVSGNYPLSSVQNWVPAAALTPFFEELGTIPVFGTVGKPVGFYVYDSNQLTQLNTLLTRTPLATLLSWTRWHVINASTPLLSLSIRRSHLNAFATPLAGITALPDRHNYCRDMVAANTGDLFIRFFIAKLLPSRDLASIQALFQWLTEAFVRNLPSLDWLDDSTRDGAASKIAEVLQILAGPGNDTWSDWSTVQLNATRLYDNYLQLQRVKTVKFWSYYLAPVPKTTFNQNPLLVNAWYTRTANSIQLPAGVMHSPWWAVADQPMYMNAARLGMLVGHEMTHGFDNNGRMYDGEGNQRNWWTSGSSNNFTSRAQCFVNQYNGISVQNSTISGSLTLSENIADGGGMHLAYSTHRWYTQQMAGYGLSPQLLPSPRLHAQLTADQLFFWSYAQSWCTVATDQYVANEVRTNSHTPAMVRVWAPLRNFAPFAEAFSCPVGSRMNPKRDEQCLLW